MIWVGGLWAKWSLNSSLLPACSLFHHGRFIEFGDVFVLTELQVKSSGHQN